MRIFRFKAIRAQQAANYEVFCFAAAPADVLAFANVDRVGRQGDGELSGFQRHQIASHIRGIRDYLVREDAVLPGAVVVAFLDGVNIDDLGNGIADVAINVGDAANRPGFIVDGQQRLTALSGIRKPGFQVLVSALVCKNYDELRQQFVLINNTRPLPKSLIYELLPKVEGLPERFTARKFSARLVDRLNFRYDSVLRGEIRQHTNPTASLSDTAVQKLIMNSASDGAIRDMMQQCDADSQGLQVLEESAFNLLNDYFRAIRTVYSEAWEGTNPKTSRLRHGAGLISMGFVMDYLYSVEVSKCSNSYEKFIAGLALLKPHTAWTCGNWQFSDLLTTSWNNIQNTPGDINLLADYLMRSLKSALRRHLQAAA